MHWPKIYVNVQAHGLGYIDIKAICEEPLSRVFFGSLAYSYTRDISESGDSEPPLVYPNYFEPLDPTLEIELPTQGHGHPGTNLKHDFDMDGLKRIHSDCYEHSEPLRINERSFRPATRVQKNIARKTNSDRKGPMTLLASSGSSVC